MIGLGVGIDYSLFIVTRFRQLLHEGLPPRDAAAEAGASAGRAVLFAGLTVAISVTGLAFFGLDFVTKLGIGSALGVLTTVLIANSLLLAVLATARPQGRPAQGAVPAADRRLGGGAGEDARRALGTLRDATRRSSSRSCCLIARTRVDVAARPAGRRRPGHAAEGADRRRAYDLLAEGFGPGFNGPIPIVVDVNDDAEAPQRIYERPGPAGRRVGRRAAAQRREDGRRSSS